jgi:SAM-dependent methyltransferase
MLGEGRRLPLSLLKHAIRGKEEMLRKFFSDLKQGSEYLNYGREIILAWSVNYINDLDVDEVKILDIGSGQGADLLNIQQAQYDKNITKQLFGIECYEPNVRKARDNGINIFSIDIEREIIPTQAGFFDLVIANQIIEHSKEIFWIFSEISRVLKKGGRAIIGVPNLASFHNRVILLFGEQPTSIELLGPHVRGFTKPSLTRFMTCDNYFRVLAVKGANFYPFPPTMSKVLSKLFPTLSVGLFILLERTDKEGKFIEVLESRFYETPYFKGITENRLHGE